MDPFAQFQSSIQRDQINADLIRLFRLQGNLPAELEAELDVINNRIQGVPEPVQNIRNFEFATPAHSLAEFLQRPEYRRAKQHKHYKKENGKDYVNTNEDALAWEDPEWAAGNARLVAAAAIPPPDEAALNRIYLDARQQQMTANREADNQEPVWELCQRSGPNDTHQEDTTLRFMDNSHTEIDWHTTIENIQELGRELGYTLAHYNKVMNRFVSYYKPQYSPLIRGMDANATARFLMSLNTPKPPRQRHFQAIKQMFRPPNTELRAIMNELHQNAQGYYAAEPEETRNNLVDNMMLLGLQKFTTGPTCEALKNLIQQQQLENIRPNWIRLQEAAITAEETYGIPQVALQFMPVGQAPCFSNNVIPLFNANIQPVDPLVFPHPTVVNPLVHGYGCPQQNYLEQPTDMRNRQNRRAPTRMVYPHNNMYNGPYIPRPAVHPQPPVQNQQPLAQPLQQPLMPPPAAVPAQAPHPAQNIMQQELDMQEVDPNELQGAAALIPLPATPRQELQNDLQLANRMQQLQDSVERGPQFFTPQEQEKQGPVLRERKNQTVSKQLTYHTNILPEQTGTIPTPLKETNELLQGLTEMLNSLKVNSTALQPAQNPVRQAEPRNYERGRTPQRDNRYRSPSPYRQQYNNDRRNNDRGRTPERDYRRNNDYRDRTPQRQDYQNRRDNYDRNRSPGPNYQNRYRTPPRDGYRSRTPTKPYDDRRQSRDNYRPQSPSPLQRQYASQNNRSSSPARPYRPDTPRTQYRQYSPRPDNRSSSPRRDNLKQIEYKPDQQNRQNQPRATTPSNDDDKRILRAINCHPNYNKSQGLMCTKCSTYGKHEEYKCPLYFNWASRPCNICKNGFHLANDCIENRQRQRTPDRASPRPDRYKPDTKN